MYGKRIFTRSSTVRSVTEVRVLVVDDDSTSLTSIARLLKLFNYQDATITLFDKVTTAQDYAEALYTLRISKGVFDLVLSDIHMPYMNGIQLQKKVEAEFRIPVILMSGEGEKKMTEEDGLEKGSYVMIKPPSSSELESLWKYIVATRKCRNNAKANKTCKEINFDDTIEEDQPYENNSNEEDEEINRDGNAKSIPKKSKLVWTTALHNKFLEAVRVIGDNRAVPKKILHYMDVPGLTRENVASHLQKYRIYMKRLEAASAKSKNGIPENWNQKPFRSSFTWSQFPVLARNSFLLNCARAFGRHLKSKASSSKKNDVSSTKFGEGSNNAIGSPVNTDKSTYNFGASSTSSQGVNSVLNTTNIFSLPATSSDLMPIIMNSTTKGLNTSSMSILESSMLSAPNNDKIDYNNRQDDCIGGCGLARAPMHFSAPKPLMMAGNTSSAAQAQVGSQVRGLSSLFGGLSCDMAPYDRDVGDKFGNNVNNYDNRGLGMEKQFVEQQQAAVVNMSNFVEQPFGAPSNMASNYVEQPSAVVAGSQVNDMSNFMNNQQPAVVSNMSNFYQQPTGLMARMCNNFVEQPPDLVPNASNFVVQPTALMDSTRHFGARPPAHVSNMSNLVTQQNAPIYSMCNNFVAQSAAPMTNMSNFVEQRPLPVVNNFSNFVEQPQQPTDVVNMNNFMEQPQRVGVGMNMMSNFVDQQPQLGCAAVNMMSNFVEQPQPAAVFPNMSNFDNFFTHNHQVVALTNKMDNISISPQQGVKSNNLNATSMAENEGFNTFSSSNELQKGFDFTSRTPIHFQDRAMSNSFDDEFSMDRLDAFVAGCFSNDIDPRNDNCDDLAGLGEY